MALKSNRIFGALTLSALAAAAVTACMALSLPHSPVSAPAYANEEQTVLFATVRPGDGAVTCTGVIVAPSTVVTASHCLPQTALMGAPVGAVSTREMVEHASKPAIASVLAIDGAIDVAVLDAAVTAPLYPAEAPLPSSGDVMHSTHNGFSVPFSTVYGTHVDVIGDSSEADLVLRERLLIGHGASGGGLFDAQGRLAGICLSFDPTYAHFVAASRVFALVHGVGR